MLRNKKAMIVLVLSLFFVVADRFFKFLSVRGVSWLYTFQNDRIAFSLPIAWSLFLSGVAAIIMLGIAIALVRAWKDGQYVRAAFFACLFFGAASNLYDRLLYGAVIDYVRIGSGFFNIADVMIGAALIALVYTDTHS